MLAVEQAQTVVQTMEVKMQGEMQTQADRVTRILLKERAKLQAAEADAKRYEVFWNAEHAKAVAQREQIAALKQQLALASPVGRSKSGFSHAKASSKTREKVR